jgi:ubiquinone/menaquinone biosynthesis C-methylase UbiE
MSAADRYVPAAGFASLTRFYDLGERLTMRSPAWRPWLAALATDRRPCSVLDVGCGTGTLAIEMARVPGVTVTGVDGDPEILTRARRKAGAEGVEWREAMADALPAADGTFDTAVTSLLLHHLAPATKAAALAEMHRVLRPGGTLLVADWGAPHGPAMRAAFFGLQLLDGHPNTVDHARGRIPGMIAEAGFVDVERLHRLRTVGGTFEILRARKGGGAA